MVPMNGEVGSRGVFPNPNRDAVVHPQQPKYIKYLGMQSTTSGLRCLARVHVWKALYDHLNPGG